MSALATSDVPYVVFKVGETTCAVSALTVNTMTELPPVVSLPKAPPHLRGMVELRGSLHRLTDLRVVLGYAPLEEIRSELLAMLEARKADHVRWIEELKKSIEESREFSLQLDPRLCAFGKWYYSYTPPAEWVKSTLREFEAPHNAIHRLASEVRELQAEGRKSDALLVLERAKHGQLNLLLRLFDLLGQQLSDAMREICILLEYGGQMTAFSVENVESIEHFAPNSFQRPSGSTAIDSKLVLGYATNPRDGSVVTILNVEALVGLGNNSTRFEPDTTLKVG